jgi:signal transduction histidine kinase
MIVPVHVRGVCTGALTFVSTTPGNDYSDADLIMAEDLGRRAGMALENASLYVQAQAAIRVRDEFLSIASHELKTPLTPLKLQTQSLRRALMSGKLQTMGMEKIEKMLDSSDRQITRISKLIDDLLDISRITSGKMGLTLEEFQLCELIDDIVERFSEEAKIARCEISVKCPAEILVRWDRFRMEQVIVNLLTNAFKYGAGGDIHIKANEKDGVVVLAIVDHGIGIQEGDQARVFGRFERAVSGTHFGGLGLGLYIVTQILEAHRGKISLNSEFGKGSTFSVTLKTNLSDDEVAKAPEKDDEAATPPGVRRLPPKQTSASSPANTR